LCATSTEDGAFFFSPPQHDALRVAYRSGPLPHCGFILLLGQSASCERASGVGGSNGKEVEESNAAFRLLVGGEGGAQGRLGVARSRVRGRQKRLLVNHRGDTDGVTARVSIREYGCNALGASDMRGAGDRRLELDGARPIAVRALAHVQRLMATMRVGGAHHRHAAVLAKRAKEDAVRGVRLLVAQHAVNVGIRATAAGNAAQEALALLADKMLSRPAAAPTRDERNAALSRRRSRQRVVKVRC
jgi:hypothetical protein